MKLDELRQPGVTFCEPLQGFVDLDDVYVAGRRRSDLQTVQILYGAGCGGSATLFAEAALRMVDEDTPHLTRGDRKEMRAVLPGDVHLDKPHERLVHDRSRLQGMPRSFLAHVLPGPVSQLLIYQWSEPLQRARIAGFPSG